jgi:hypothetical protein
LEQARRLLRHHAQNFVKIILLVEQAGEVDEVFPVLSSGFHAGESTNFPAKVKLGWAIKLRLAVKEVRGLEQRVRGGGRIRARTLAEIESGIPILRISRVQSAYSSRWNFARGAGLAR